MLVKVSLVDAIAQEISRADGGWGTLHSSHEGLGVLTEEYQELLEAIRANDLTRIRREAIQVAAVAYRLAMACDMDAAFRSRSLPPAKRSG